MLTVKEKTTLVGVSEIRTHWDEILKSLDGSNVIIEKRNAPLAALISIRRYMEIEEQMEWIEDIVLGFMAKKRDRKRTRYLPLEKVEKKAGLG